METIESAEDFLQLLYSHRFEPFYHELVNAMAKGATESVIDFPSLQQIVNEYCANSPELRTAFFERSDKQGIMPLSRLIRIMGSYNGTFEMPFEYKLRPEHFLMD